eukprot:scaffold2565_cov29-Cyclotella_meneghiniana.AAC.1
MCANDQPTAKTPSYSPKHHTHFHTISNKPFSSKPPPCRRQNPPTTAAAATTALTTATTPATRAATTAATTAAMRRKSLPTITIASRRM